jgi:4'-phosphopantetheinyl transferase EntD
MTAVQGLDRVAQTQAVIAALFDGPVAVGVTDPRGPQPPALGKEAAHLGHAIDARQREFAAGRAAARIAMAQLGLPPVAIPAAPDRAPLWPKGIMGSISHTGLLCAAVVSTGSQSPGLDIEQDTPLSRSLLSTICSPSEQQRIAGPDQLWLAKLVFSAKEAVYKAQYPLTGMLFGFDHIDITFDLPARGFTATFLKPAGGFAAGDKLLGRFDRIDGHLVTAAWADKSLFKGA